MIYGNLENLQEIAEIGKNYNKVIDFLQTQELLNIAVGRYDLADGCYVNIVEYQTAATDEGEFEAHRVYDDVHIVIVGTERVAWQDITDAAPCNEFNEKEDYGLFLANTEQEVILTASNFVVFEPTDIHKPGLSVNGVGVVKKAIFKIFREDK